MSHPGQTIPSLDGIRAVAVLIVVASHARLAQQIPGGFGVTIFFFLSGFLITTLFVREWSKHGSIAIPAFYLRRLLRLSPPLWITLAIAYALVAFGLLPGTFRVETVLAQLLYFYNYYLIFVPGATEGAVGLNILWSLSVEEHFYLLYPLVFLAFARKRITTVHIVVALFAFTIWRLVNWYVLHASVDAIYTRSDTRFDSILWGSLLALLRWEGYTGRIFPSTPARRNLLLAAAAIVLALCFVVRGDSFRETWRYTLQGMALMPFFHYAVQNPEWWLFRPLNWAVASKIGEYSYSIYLIHYVLLASFKFQGLPLKTPLAVFGAILTGSILYAALLNRFVEKPLKRLRARLAR